MKTISLKSLFELIFPFRPLVKRINELIDSVRASPFAFTSLPLEIIVEILKVLDWRALLRIRQTCRHLDTVSRTRTVWKGQYYQHVTEHKYPIHLEMPLESYSAEDLERWVLVRRSADVGWRSDNVKPIRSRWIDYRGAGCASIVPGGRWLLVGDTRCGSVTVYDLDAPQLTGEPLIPPDGQDDQAVHHIAIAVDPTQQSSALAFTIALSPAVHMEPSPMNVSIWRVTLTGCKANARLVAKRLRSFQAHNHCHINDIAFHNNLYARTIYRGYFCYIEVFDWERSSSSTHCKAILFPGIEVERIHLLPGDRLLAVSNTHLMIYNFVIVDGVETIAPTIAPGITHPVWSMPLTQARKRHSSLSPAVHHRRATHFILTAGNLISNLVIPTNNGQSPYLVEMTELGRNPATCVIGVERVLVQHKGDSVSRLSFTWDDRNPGSRSSWRMGSCARTVSGDYPTTYDNIRPPRFDEETGCIVQNSREGVWVVDTALIYMQNMGVE